MSTTKPMTVNGKKFTVVRVGAAIVQLVGPRGGEAMLVQNKHSLQWVLIEGATRRPRVSAIDTVDADWSVLS